MSFTIGVGAGKFLRVRRIFTQISPNLPEKNSKENDLQKRNIFSQISPELAQIFPNLPEKH